MATAKEKDLQVEAYNENFPPTTAKEMYINNRKDLRTLEGLIRNRAEQKEITKAFKKFQKTFLVCNLEYDKEKSVMVKVKTQKK